MTLAIIGVLLYEIPGAFMCGMSIAAHLLAPGRWALLETSPGRMVVQSLLFWPMFLMAFLAILLERSEQRPQPQAPAERTTARYRPLRWPGRGRYP